MVKAEKEKEVSKSQFAVLESEKTVLTNTMEEAKPQGMRPLQWLNL